VDGDFYINTATSTIFGPKIALVWPAGVSLIGATGSTGPQGSQGVAGPIGPNGPQGPTGTTGATGSQGLQGSPGPTGPQGPTGVAGTNGSGFDFLNAFDSNTTYAADDVVTYDGSTYVAIAASSGPNNPTPNTNASVWSVMAQEGATGAQGSTGSTGATGSQGATCIRGPRSYRRYGCNWRTRFGGSYGDNWATRSRRCHRRNRSEWLPWLARSRWTNWPGGACRSSGNKWEWLRLPQRV